MSLVDKLAQRRGGICLYGLAPPRRETDAERLAEIAQHQVARVRGLGADGLVVYDLQDETARTAAPRPFPFLPTIDAERYARHHLAALEVPRIVYRAVSASPPTQFERWLDEVAARPEPSLSVLVGAPARVEAPGTLKLVDAYRLVRERAPDLVLGGIAIAERHARSEDEHTRLIAKMGHGCRFFVSQAVYDVAATKSLLSDYALALGELGEPPVPLLLTFAPCGSLKTLAFMKWLGISVPRWLENELRHASDPLEQSVRLCVQTFTELASFAREKGLPLGVNVESVSIRKAEIEASVALFEQLRVIAQQP